MANFIQQFNAGGITYDLHDSEFIIDTRTASGAALTGETKAAALFDGMQITFWMNYAAASNATLNLTLADGTTTGAIPCYYSGTTRLGTHYAAGNAVHFTYRENVTIGSTTVARGWWSDANYTVSDTKVTQNATTTANNSYRVLLSNSVTNGAETAAVNKAATLSYNPSSGMLTSPHIQADTRYLSRPTQTNGIPDVTVKPQISTTRANRLAFLPADQIIIEKTTDGGATWVDAQIPDYAKAALFSEVRYSVFLPLLNGVKNINCGLRITITGMKYNVPSGTPETEKYNYWNSTYVKSSERYCQLEELYFFVSSNSDGISLKVERAKGASPTTWESAYDSGSTFALTGWSGSDYVKILAGQTFGGGTGQTGNYWNYRLTFFTRNSTGGTTLATTYTTSAQTLLEIRGYGTNVWTYSNNYMKDDHLYSWDYNKNVTFPGAVTATSGFSGSGENLTSLSASNISSGTLSTARLPDAYGDTKNPYAAKVANTVLAGPASGNDAAPTFRQLVAADIPLLTKSKISDFPTSMPASDVSAWAKAATKPSYSLSEINGTTDLQKIEALTGTSGFLKKTAANVWTLDTTSYLPTTGGNVTGDIVLLKQVSSGAPGDSYGLIFQRGTLTDNYNDWMIIDSGGYLHFQERGSGSTSWNDRVVFNTTGNVSATSFTGSGASLTSLNASNLSSGTVPVARIPDLSSTYIPVSQKGAASGVATLDSNSKVPIVQSNYLYGKCSTAAGTAAKVASITGYSETSIANMEGVTVFIAFKNGNTADNPTLNISSSGAHPIVVGTYDDPANIGRFSNGLHAFTLVKAADNSYYWWVNEGRDTVPEAPTSEGYYALRVQSGMNNIWSSFTIPSAPTTGTLTLSASGWSGNGPYSHSVTISGTTANSKIDLQPDSTVLAQMTTDGTTAIYIENNNGTLTAWAMGAAPTATLTIQYTKMEVG